MKKILFAVALFALSFSAYATGYTPSDPSLQQSQELWQKQQQAQGQAQQVDVATKATGGRATSSSTGGTSTLNDADKASTRVYVAPPPSNTQVPPAAGCIITRSLAGSVGWSFLSASGTEQYSDWVCTNLNMAIAEYSVCHYRNADVIRVETYNKLNPNSAPLTANDKEENLTAAECANKGKVVERLAPKKACANPKRHDVPCARPGGIRKDDGCCYYSCAGKS